MVPSLPSLPSVKIPKNMRKLKKWNTNLTLDTIGSSIGSNITSLVNRFYPKSNEAKKQENEIPPGVSTISGSYVSDNNVVDGGRAQKSNFGLYALKHDRANKETSSKGLGKGLQLLHLPKLHKKDKSEKQKEIIHEKFQTCERKKNMQKNTSSSLDSMGSIDSVNNCQEVQFDIESDMECHRVKPAVPPRRRKSSQISVATVVSRNDIPQKPKQKPIPSPRASPVPPVPKPKALGTFVAQNKPEPGTKLATKKTHARNKSVDIFMKQEKDVFQDFDNYFEKDRKPPPPAVPIRTASSSSSNQSSFEEMAELRAKAAERRFSSTIKVQNFNDTNIQRCKSLISPKHKIRPEMIDKAIDSESSSNELKSPQIVTNQAKKIPQGILKQRTPSPKEELPIEEPQEIPNKKFFVYYNDEDELVFNQEYQKQQNQAKNAPSQPLSLFTGNTEQQQQKLSLSDFNHNDVIYKNYYNIDQSDSLRSMASSSDGIFI